MFRKILIKYIVIVISLKIKFVAGCNWLGARKKLNLCKLRALNFQN